MAAIKQLLAAPRNIWCVGRNYAAHVKELGNAVEEAGDPMIFLKAGSSMLANGQPLVLPSFSKDVHHEIELAIQLGEDLQPVRAAVALDLTARDLQAELKRKVWPWTLAKSFPSSTPLGSYFDVKGVDLQGVQLHLEVNGKTRQNGNTSDMIYKIPTLLDYVRSRFPVVPGDLILTGTPHGVSALAAGDKLVARVLGPQGQQLSEGSWEVSRAN